MISFKAFVFNPFQENTYVISAENKDCIIIDPGCFDREEHQTLIQYIADNQLNPKAVWLTHAHIDHVLGLQFCLDHWKIPYFISASEIPQLKAVEVYAPNYGFNDFQPVIQEGFLLDQSHIFLGIESFSILIVPGHAPGHVAFYHQDSKQVWAGDVLFRQSIGRTDLPGGDFETLKKSIVEKLYTLPNETIVYPGHGPATDIGFEKKYNPFVSL